MSHSLRWDPDLTKAEQGQSILRDPLRAGLAAAGIALAIGSLRPWAEGTAGSQPQQFGGFDGAGEYVSPRTRFRRPAITAWQEHALVLNTWTM